MRTIRFSTCRGLAAAVAVGLAATSPLMAHVRVNTPNGGEVLDAGSVFTVEWEIAIQHNLQNWDLWYSTTSKRGPWIDIAMDVAPGGSAVGSVHTYDWTIPNIVSEDTWMRVRMDNTATDYFDVSDASFMIVPEPSFLQAGDADQDLDFDQLDLVQVQIAAKYLSGRTATWGEGDWNGAPGGSQASPPEGDGLFNQLDIVAAQQAGIYLSGPYAAARPDGQESDGQASIMYNAGSGKLAVDTLAGTDLTSINIDSAAGIFTGEPAQNLGGNFDNDGDHNIFKATFGSSFDSLNFGNVAQPGVATSLLLDDLTIVGSLQGDGALANVDLVFVPEPSTVLSLILGTLALLARRRHASNVGSA